MLTKSPKAGEIAIFSKKIDRFLGDFLGKNRLSVKSKKVVGLRVREGLFFILFVHLTKEESQAIQPAKEEFAIGILWIQGICGFGLPHALMIWSTSTTISGCG